MADVVKLGRRIGDGLRNLVSGLGAGQDKTSYSGYVMPSITQVDLETVYRTTWLGRKIHDIPPKDMTRNWRAWQAEDDDIELIEDVERRLNVRKKIRQAITWARLYGGAGMIIGIGGDPMSEAEEKIAKGGLQYLHVVTRFDVSLGQAITDLTDPWFGYPEYFERASTDGKPSIRIHPSRMVIFKGNEIPSLPATSTMFGGDWFWGDPILFAILDAIKASDTSMAAISSLLQEAKVDVVHIPGLMDHLGSAGYESKLIERLNLASLVKSINNTLILDGGDGGENSGERWEVRQQSFEGLPDVQKVFLQLVSGAADIPATRLIGQAPQGMNATGDSDTRNYYDRLASEQNDDLTPAISRLDDYIIMSGTGSRDPAIHYVWNPLWNMSPKEKADRDYVVSQTVEKYANLGAVPNDAMEQAIQNLLVEDSVFPGLETALEESEMESDLMAEPEGPPVDPLTGLPALPPPANDPGPPPVAQSGTPQAVAPAARRRAAADRRRRLLDKARPKIRDAAARSLYVRRDLVNTTQVLAWARSQGFENPVPAKDLHVTIMYSRYPVDWMRVGGSGGSLTIPEGGPRLVEGLGGDGAVVLMFSSWELSYRHGEMRDIGASWDHYDYQPHITITYNAGGVDLETVEAYRGPLEFGPEIFEELNPEWMPGHSM